MAQRRIEHVQYSVHWRRYGRVQYCSHCIFSYCKAILNFDARSLGSIERQRDRRGAGHRGSSRKAGKGDEGNQGGRDPSSDSGEAVDKTSRRRHGGSRRAGRKRSETKWASQVGNEWVMREKWCPIWFLVFFCRCEVLQGKKNWFLVFFLINAAMFLLFYYNNPIKKRKRCVWEHSYVFQMWILKYWKFPIKILRLRLATWLLNLKIHRSLSSYICSSTQSVDQKRMSHTVTKWEWYTKFK
jgi:hypothetical protein